MYPDVVELIGGIAGLLTTVSLVPQVLKVVRDRETAAISLWAYIVFLCGIALWIVYGYYRHSIAIIVANVVTLALASCVLGLKLHFERARSS